MKETTKTSRAAGQLEKMFRQLNQDSFGGELEEPIITIQSTPGAYGHVTVGKTWKRKDDWRHELNISADWLERPIEEITATLIHEMVHLYNIKHEIQDCSRGGSYHNKKFRDSHRERRQIRLDNHQPNRGTFELHHFPRLGGVQNDPFPLWRAQGPRRGKEERRRHSSHRGGRQADTQENKLETRLSQVQSHCKNHKGISFDLWHLQSGNGN